MINGVTDLVISKADVLSGANIVDICETYDMYGNKVSNQQVVMGNAPAINPIYASFRGWGDLSGAKTREELPKDFQKYLEYIEHETQLPISIISTGPDRTQIIYH